MPAITPVDLGLGGFLVGFGRVLQDAVSHLVEIGHAAIVQRVTDDANSPLLRAKPEVVRDV